MEQSLHGNWEQEEENPAFGFLMAAPLNSFNEAAGSCLACSAPGNTGVWSETRTAVIRALHGVIDNIFSSIVIARPIIYQPASTSCCNVADVFSMQRESVRGLAELRRKVSSFDFLKQNWDGEGAESISAATVTTALQIIEQIAIVLFRKNTESRPSVRAFPDGSIFFKWIYGNRELAISVVEGNIEVQRWEPIDTVHSLGLWAVPVDGITEHVEWVLT